MTFRLIIASNLVYHDHMFFNVILTIFYLNLMPNNKKGISRDLTNRIVIDHILYIRSIIYQIKYQ